MTQVNGLNKIILILFFWSLLIVPVLGQTPVSPAATSPSSITKSSQTVPAAGQTAPSSSVTPGTDSFNHSLETDQSSNSTIQTKSQALKKGQETLLTTISESKPQVEWSLTIGKIVWSIIFIFISYYLIKYTTQILETISERWENTRLTIKRLIPFVRIFQWIFATYLVIVGVLSPPMETLLALTASAGLALGFASQDILKNIFGGIMILMDRPFQTGDKIQVKDHYGEVVQIGLRTVRIVTPDDSLVSIPNSDLVNQAVSNANNGASNCQVVAEFYLPLHIDLIRVKKIAHRAAVVSQYVYLNKPIVIIFKNEIHQGKSLIKMRVKAYVLDIRFEFAFASEITEIVLQELFKRALISSQELDSSPLPSPIPA
ncbi:MAG: mechanosensitive ion channel [SAR324 cluster bacterium]|nr:mechanosensitive ion channel [SAR324 cluster bacterium]